MEIKLPMKDLEKLAEEATNTAEFCLSIYKKVIPDWDKIERLNHFPKANKNFNNFCLGIDIDKFKTPMGAWFNNGFSMDENIPDETVFVDVEKIIYSTTNN